MKRFFSILLGIIVFLICACQPTPEVEYVVNKGDDVVEQKLSAPAEQEMKETKYQRFPDRWDEGPTQVNDWLKLTVQAEVIQKEDGVYPVYRTRQRTVEQEDVIELLNKLLPAPVARMPLVDTKADWTRAYQEWLDDFSEQQAWVAAGKPDDGADRDEAIMSPEDIDRISREYQQLIREAPDALESTPISDYSGLELNGGTCVYALADGTKASVDVFVNGGYTEVSVLKNCSGSGYIYYQYTHDRERELGEVKPFLTVKLSREQAEATLMQELDRLGFSEFTVARAAPANLCLMGRSEEGRPLSAGWGFQLRRSNGGYPLSDVSFMDSRALVYDDADNFAVNRPISDEMIEVFIDDSGLRVLRYLNPKEVVSLENENVELLPFEQVKLRIKNALVAGTYAD